MPEAPRHERIHFQNVRIAAAARRHHFDDRIGIPFLCECDDEDCHEFVVLPLRDYEGTLTARLVVVAEGHPVTGATLGEPRDGYVLYGIRESSAPDAAAG
jgi:hypothetical protein